MATKNKKVKGKPKKPVRRVNGIQPDSTPKKEAEFLDGFTELTINQRAFLAAYANSGNIRSASRAIKMDRTNHHLWMKDNSVYQEAFHLAELEAGEYLEELAMSRAQAGSDVMIIFMLKGKKPDVYRERSSVDFKGDLKHGGKITLSVEEYTDEELDSLPLELKLQFEQHIQARRQCQQPSSDQPASN